MPKKKTEPELSETLAELFADIPANYDAIVEVIAVQWERLVEIRDGAQDSLTWLSALRTAMLNVKLKSLDKK